MDDMDSVANQGSAFSSNTCIHDSASLSSSMGNSIGPEANNGENVPGNVSSAEEEASLLFELPTSQKTLQHPQQDLRSEEYRQLFHLPLEEVLVRDFNCALQTNILLQGHMYLFVRYVCFYSNIFGFEKKKIIPLRDITSVIKARTAGIFPNAIEIVAWGKKHFFGSFLSRDEAYRLIVEGWALHSESGKSFLISQDTNSSPSTPDQTQSGSFEGTQTSQLLTSPDMNFVERVIEEAPEEIKESCNETANDGVCALVDELISEGTVTTTLEESIHRASSAHACKSTWQVDDIDAPKVPAHFKMVAESKFPIDVEEFFRLFFSNEAKDFTKKFHSKCGDEDFQCTPWSENRHFGQVRDVSFRHPVKIYFGPKFVYCQIVQRFRVYKNSHLMIEASQQMNDMPYGDYFRVEGLWDVERISDDESNQCKLRIYVNVAFSKNTFWKAKIEQGTYDESREAYGTWINDAHALLEEMDNNSVKAMDGVSALTAMPNNLLPSPTSELGNGVSVIPGQEAQSEYATVKEYNGDQDATDRQHFAGNPARDLSEEFNLLPNKAQSTVQTFPVKSCDFRSLPMFSNIYSSLSFHWKPGEQYTLILALLFAVIIVITQIGIIILLARHPTVQYIPSAPQTTHQGTGQSVKELQNMETTTWLERRVNYLEEEITIIEAQFRSIQHELTLLKKHLQLLDLFNSKIKSD